MNPEADKPQTPQTPEQAAGLPGTTAPSPQSEKQAAKVDELSRRFKAMPAGKRTVLVALIGLVAAAIIAAVAVALSSGDAGTAPATGSAENKGATSSNNDQAGTAANGASAQNGDKPAANPPASAVNTNPSAASTITIKDVAFSPATLTVAKNTVVTWKNDDSAAHAIDKAASQASGPHSPQLKPGSSYSYSFTAAGTYKYICVMHPNMTGTVVVKD